MIYFVTGNRGKLVEAQGIFGDVIQKNLGYTEIQADTLEDVVIFGMTEVTERLKGPVMIEDAGLFVHALKGFPGVYSAYVQRTIGNDGILKLMQDLEDRRAYFRSVVGYAEPDTDPVIFSGEVHGIIGFEQRGSKGFGYDPIFFIDGKSLGEMDIDEKNRISHRGESMKALAQWLESR
jgi:XTP/dITP diphosphohydrolase